MDDSNLIAGPYRREDATLPEPSPREYGVEDDEVPFHVPRD
jgi:hypothetical protein